jgi:hypothetical protein
MLAHVTFGYSSTLSLVLGKWRCRVVFLLWFSPPFLLRARGALQDLDRTPQEPGHYDDYLDRHPRNGSAPCLDDALLRAPFTPSTSRERSTARLGPHPAGARTLRRLPRPGGTELRQGFLTLSPGHSYPDVLRPAMFDRCQKTYIILFVLAPPSSVAFAAPAVPAVAVPAGGGSYAGVLGGAG